MRPSSRLDPVLRTTLALLILPATAVAMSSCALFRVLRGAPRPKLDSHYWNFARISLRVGGTRLEVHGLEKVRPEQGYVVVPNHESNWDPLALLAAFRGVPLRFVVKREISDIPIFGWAVIRTGSVRVERTGEQGDVDRIRERMATRPPDISMLFYAKGHARATERSTPSRRAPSRPRSPTGCRSSRSATPAATASGSRSSSGCEAVRSSSRWGGRFQWSTSATRTGRSSGIRPLAR